MTVIRAFTLLAMLIMISAGTTAEADIDQIKEYVRVSQMELIVRALTPDGIPRAGLTADDFMVFEYDKPVPVTSCTEIRRRLGTVDLSGNNAIGGKVPRVILVYFWVWQQNDSLTRSLNYLFERVYRDGDTVILMLPTFSRVIYKRDEVAPALYAFNQHVVKWTQRMEQDITSTARHFSVLCDDFVPKFRSRQGSDEPESLTFQRVFNEFRSRIEMEWRSFQQRHLEAGQRRLRNLATALKSMKNEKWALVFFQQPVFPALHPYANLMMRFENPDYINQLRGFAQKMIRDLNSPRNTATQLADIEQAFIQAGATYQLVQLDSRSLPTDHSQYLVMRDVFSDWKWAFQRITRATGGRIVTDNQADRALARLVNAEDVHYRITYAPQRVETEKVRDLRRVNVRARNKTLEVFHQERLLLSEIDEIKLVDFQCRPDHLNFVLSGYSVRLQNGALHSSVQVWLTAETPRGETMEFQRHFSVPDPFLDVSMSLKFPRPGPYRVYFSAEDRHTGLSVSRSQRIVVPKAQE
ncbi:MAG: hypothetical protein JXA62_07615 [Candidatus Aminicenantes bacterium]|nr:hypothetical protein [Candidatus Aminicenantes bacterium]